MNPDLPLQSFGVESYRGIRRLRLPQLGAVNLFVGLNNAGKSSLLEAIRIHAEPQPVSALWDLLRQRNEYNSFRGALLRGREDISEAEVTEAARAVESLFFRGAEGNAEPKAIFTAQGARGGSTHLFLSWWRAAGSGSPPAFFSSVDDPLISVDRNGNVSSLPLKGFLGQLTPGDDEVLLIGPGGFDGRRIAAFWSRAAGLGHAPQVEEAFRCFLPQTRRIHALAGVEGFFPVLAVELDGSSRPVPLADMGDGARRVLGIVLAMVNTVGGVLLVDEVENGLHHSVQSEVWGAIFRLAEQLKIQVFATTHSWDAVVGFQDAANRSPLLGMLYRLEREDDGNVYAEAYSEDEVAIAAQQHVEVR